MSSGHHAELDKATGFCFFDNISVAGSTMEMGQKIYQYAEKLITIMLEMDWGLPVVAEFKPNTMGECRVTPHNVSITLQLLLIRKAY